ncbi:helix-turn-helix transcriptional regulator [Leeuwenhoekiella marinoflava]|uniref:helix-turn-helix domain-containing protein n=1 Tax=Leeuwenhoekiella marinoflava TaxID=988 RepID=UPI003001BD3E
MIIEIIISHLDFLLIERVRELRIQFKPYMDQVTLAQKIGVSEGYIGNIENPKIQSKYNIRMLHRVAEALNLESYHTLFPDKIVENDLVRIRLKLKENSSRKHEIDKSGKAISRFEILMIKPLNKKEYQLWNSKNKIDKLKYLQIISD